MYSVLGNRTIAIRRLYRGTLLHKYDNIHKFPPISDLFVSFGFTKGPPLLHSTEPNTIINGKNLIVNGTIGIGDDLTFDFSTFDLMRIVKPTDHLTHIRLSQKDLA